MKFKSLLAIIAVSVMPVGFSTAGLAEDAQSGAKGLYFAQMEQPQAKMNTGVRYWIELRRAGSPTTQRVSNKTVFRSGDQIRFHVQSNINGYAYILLRSGSQGEREVLFPAQERADNNRVLRGREYVIPQNGALTFDENPGLEKLSLMVSRTPIDAKAYLDPVGEDTALIASAQDGSKDLIPAKILVAYNPAPVPVKFPTINIETTKKVNGVSATKPAATKTQTAAVKTQAKVTSAKAQKKSSNVAVKHQKEKVRIAESLPVVKPSNQAANSFEDEGVVTVVYNDPTGVLSVDVALEHQ